MVTTEESCSLVRATSIVGDTRQTAVSITHRAHYAGRSTVLVLLIRRNTVFCHDGRTILSYSNFMAAITKAWSSADVKLLCKIDVKFERRNLYRIVSVYVP